MKSMLLLLAAATMAGTGNKFHGGYDWGNSKGFDLKEIEKAKKRGRKKKRRKQ